MKDFVINKCMDTIIKYQNFDSIKLDEIRYGLTSLYLTISKVIVIIFIALILNIIDKVVIFMLVYNLVRLPSFGIHATKSWICLLVSTITFIGIPILCLNLHINIFIKLLIGIISIILISKNSPADTKKRPIINLKRRLIYKLLSIIISILYVFLSLIIHNNYISNFFLFGLILQNIVISPLTYKIFKQPYNNYKNYIK